MANLRVRFNGTPVPDEDLTPAYREYLETLHDARQHELYLRGDYVPEEFGPDEF
jgi:hypothetical protein